METFSGVAVVIFSALAIVFVVIAAIVISILRSVDNDENKLIKETIDSMGIPIRNKKLYNSTEEFIEGEIDPIQRELHLHIRDQKERNKMLYDVYYHIFTEDYLNNKHADGSINKEAYTDGKIIPRDEAVSFRKLSPVGYSYKEFDFEQSLPIIETLYTTKENRKRCKDIIKIWEADAKRYEKEYKNRGDSQTTLI